MHSITQHSCLQKRMQQKLSTSTNTKMMQQSLTSYETQYGTSFNKTINPMDEEITSQYQLNRKSISLLLLNSYTNLKNQITTQKGIKSQPIQSLLTPNQDAASKLKQNHHYVVAKSIHVFHTGPYYQMFSTQLPQPNFNVNRTANFNNYCFEFTSLV